jgi:hypothetical protein
MFFERIAQWLTPWQWGIFWMVLSVIFAFGVIGWLIWRINKNPKAWGYEEGDDPRF